MRLRRPKREFVTAVKEVPTGYAFEMSPGVSVVVQPNEPGTEQFAEGLANIIQRVAQEEWT